MEEKCRAVVLRAVDYKDNDKILTLFSLENGVISAAIRGVKRANAKLKFAAQPFSFSEYVFNVKGDKRSVISADLIDSFYPLREDILKLYSGAVALEFINYSLAEGIDGKEIFVLLLEFLQTLSYKGVPPRLALIKFLYSALCYTGYDLTVGHCCKCRKTLKNRTFFDFDLGGTVCEDCRESTDVEMNPLTVKLLCEVNSLQFADLGAAEYPLMIQNKAIKLLCYFTKINTGLELRSANELMLLTV